jgi:hypothetical protein
MPVMFHPLHKNVFKKGRQRQFLPFTVLQLLVCNNLSPVVNVYSYVILRQEDLVFYNLWCVHILTEMS